MGNGTRSGRIVAMGGGGFSMEPDNPALDRYVLGLVDAPRPKVCFLPTASGDARDYVDRFHGSFSALPCEASHLSLFFAETADHRSLLLNQDVIYVGGGGTRNMLVLWREWGLDRILREAWENGIVLAGLSAGAICWFEEGLSDSVLAGDYRPLPCLGFLPGSNCPHYDGEPGRRPAYHRLLAGGEIGDGYAADDGVALHFVGDRLERIVSSRPDARAYRVERRDERVVETMLVPDYLAAGGESGAS